MELRWRAFKLVPWVWTTWERIYVFFRPVTPVAPGSLFSYHRMGDVLELHLDGRALVEVRARQGYTTYQLVRQLRAELAVLASRIRSGELNGVASIKGVSLMGEAGRIFGFEVRPLPPTLGNRLERYFMVGLDAIYHPRGLREQAMKRWPTETTMTRETLLERYPEKSDRSIIAR